MIPILSKYNTFHIPYQEPVRSGFGGRSFGCRICVLFNPAFRFVVWLRLGLKSWGRGNPGGRVWNLKFGHVRKNGMTPRIRVPRNVHRLFKDHGGDAFCGAKPDLLGTQWIGMKMTCHLGPNVPIETATCALLVKEPRSCAGASCLRSGSGSKIRTSENSSNTQVFKVTIMSWVRN